MEDDIQQDDIFNRENLRRALRFESLKTFQPVAGVGTMATFEVAIPGLLKIKACSLKRRAGEPPRLVTGRLDRSGGFAVELRAWLRNAIFEEAVKALRARLEGELSALEKDGARAREPDEDTTGLTRMLAGVEAGEA